MLLVVEHLYLVYPQAVHVPIHHRPVPIGLGMVSVPTASTRQLRRDNTVRDLAIFVKKILSKDRPNNYPLSPVV